MNNSGLSNPVNTGEQSTVTPLSGTPPAGKRFLRLHIVLRQLDRALGPREVLLWCLLFLMALLGTLHHIGGPRLSDDSYQYLSEAENLRKGYGFKTSIIHFDTERLSGQIPAPLTTFPPGYSLAIAALSLTGLSRETAALVLSAGSFIFLVPLVSWAAGLLELSSMATRMVLLMLLGSAAAGAYATALTTESLFTALSLGALLCLLRHERGTGGALTAALAGNFLVGCAFWVRYAGLFLFVAVAVHLVLQANAKRDRRSLAAAACLTLPAALIGCLLFRNTVLTGSWKGGNTKVVTHALIPVMKQFVVSTYHLFFGTGVSTRLGPLQLALGLGFTLLVLTLAQATRMSGPRAAIGSLFPGASLLLVYAAVYNGAMIYLGVFSVISFESRMFYPLFPVYLLLCGLILTRLRSLSTFRLAPLAWTASVAIIVVPYLAINLESIMAQRPDSPHQVVEASFALSNQAGQSLSAWLEANVPPDAVLVATNGQATAYALKRKTVSLVSSLFSDQHWDEPEVRALMRQYGANYLIVYPGIDPMIEPVQQESPFLEALAGGWHPQWLQPMTSNNSVVIFRRLPTR